MKRMKLLVFLLLSLILLFLSCESAKEIITHNDENDISAKIDEVSYYIILNNVGVFTNLESETFFKPGDDFKWEKVDSYTKTENDIESLELFPGTLKNIKSAIIKIKGKTAEFLYFQNTDINYITIEGLSKDGDGECDTPEDCEEKHGPPPIPLEWQCIKNMCYLSM